MLGNLRSQVQEIIKAKKIWPFPSAADGKDSGYEERSAICIKEKYQIWQSKKVEEQGQAWRLLNGTFFLHLITFLKDAPSFPNLHVCSLAPFFRF